MVREFVGGYKRSKATTEEWQVIHMLRLASLEAAVREANDGVLLAVDERAGWTSTVRNVGRGFDGELRIVITVRDPEDTVKLRRKVRLHRAGESTLA